MNLETDASIGAAWRQDSSLEKWFPFTAEELVKLKAELAALHLEYEDIKRRWGLALQTPRKEDLDVLRACLGFLENWPDWDAASDLAERIRVVLANAKTLEETK